MYSTHDNELLGSHVIDTASTIKFDTIGNTKRTKRKWNAQQKHQTPDPEEEFMAQVRKEAAEASDSEPSDCSSESDSPKKRARSSRLRAKARKAQAQVHESQGPLDKLLEERTGLRGEDQELVETKSNAVKKSKPIRAPGKRLNGALAGSTKPIRRKSSAAKAGRERAKKTTKTPTSKSTQAQNPVKAKACAKGMLDNQRPAPTEANEEAIWTGAFKAGSSSCPNLEEDDDEIIVVKTEPVTKHETHATPTRMLSTRTAPASPTSAATPGTATSVDKDKKRAMLLLKQRKLENERERLEVEEQLMELDG